MDTIIYINNLEMVLLVLSLLVLFFLALKNIKSIKISIILVILLIPALYLSIEGTTQFNDNDGYTSIKEVINLQNSGMEIWYKVGNRTSDAIIGTFLALFQKYTYIGKTQTDSNKLKMYAKSMHWLLGFLVITAIYALINQFYLSKNQTVFYFLIYFYSILLFPANVHVFKIFTYDLLSMTLGVLTIVLLLIAIKIKSSQYALVGIIISVLAAQEKVIASPTVLLAFIVFTYVKLSQLKNEKSNVLFAVYYSFYGIFIAFLTSLLTFLIVAIVAREGNIPNISFAQVSYPILTYMGVLVRAIQGGDYSSATFPIGPTLFLVGILVSIISIALFNANTWITQKFLVFVKDYIRLTSIIMLLGVILVGVMGTYGIEAFYHPQHPILKGYYFPPYPFNNLAQTILHFNAKTLIGHYSSYISFSYAVFINAIPSIYFLILLVIFLHKQHGEKLFFGYEMIALLMLIVPLFYVITSTPVINKYFNLFLFLVILFAGLGLTTVVTNYSSLTKSVVLLVFTLTMVTEILPFRPVYDSFRPIWSNYPDEYNKKPIIGKISPWFSHGGEMFQLCKKIEKKITEAQIKTDKVVNIYWPGSGEWIEFNKHIKSDSFFMSKMFDDLGYYKIDGKMVTTFPRLKESDFVVINEKGSFPASIDESGYYLVNRVPLTNQRGGFFIENVEPFVTVSYRGYVVGWAYRGDQIRDKFQK